MIYTYKNLSEIKEIEIDYEKSKELNINYLYKFNKDIYIKINCVDQILKLIFVDKDCVIDSNYIYAVNIDLIDLYFISEREFVIATDDEFELKKYLLLE